MMIDALMNGIAARLKEIYPDAAVFIDESEQGFIPPAFWIIELKTTNRGLLKGRYLRRYNLDVHYFPKNENPTREINGVSDTLMTALEYIGVGASDGRPVRGEDMSYETSGGVLHFFVSYPLFFRTEKEKPPFMMELKEKQHLKG